MVQNRLFVAYKPPFVTSNGFLGRLKRRYGVKHAGFSGTLDPFAQGCLIVALGQYTRLFQYLAKTPKRYRAVLWLGAHSETLDIEGVTRIDQVKPVDEAAILKAMAQLSGEQIQVPPKYSALRVGGRRAYDLARAGEDFKLPERTVTIDAFELVSYRHPFITFECSVSEGTYVRTLGADLAALLGCAGSLSFLERLSEGRLCYENEKPLNPLDFIDLPRNRYPGDPQDLYVGKKLTPNDFENPAPGVYLVESFDFFVIIELQGKEAIYRLGHMVNFASN